MIQNDFLCEQHRLQITNICISNHQCSDRRLCNSCVFKTHFQISKEDLPLVEDFKQLIKEQFHDSEEENYKSILNSIESLIKKINSSLQQIKNLANYLIEQIKSTDKSIFEMKAKSKKQIWELTKSDIDFIVKMLKSQWDQRDIQKRNKEEIFQKKLNKINEICKSFNENILNWASQYSQEIREGVKLQGKIEKFLKHGNFYYVFEDGSKEFAGTYDQGIKQGIWKNYLGQGPNENFDCELVNYGEAFQSTLNLEKKNIYYKIAFGKSEIEKQEQKQGQWTETVQEYEGKISLNFQGQYEKGVRVGYWQIKLNERTIGGGNYDQQGIKNGEWTDLDDQYGFYFMVTHTGQYKEGVRVGKWSTTYYKNKIEGGNYDDQGIKIGCWMELAKGNLLQITYSGEYMNGMRFGDWVIKLKNQIIGGGYYDDKGMKQKFWTDEDQLLGYHYKVTQSGNYKNGLRVGYWSILFMDVKMGGGEYNEEGMKIGEWTELDERYGEWHKIIHTGQYFNGFRVGNWQSYCQSFYIGGGCYDQKGMKIGKWTDLDKLFGRYIYQPFYQEFGGFINRKLFARQKPFVQNNWPQPQQFRIQQSEFKTYMTQVGEYKFGRRVGQWIYSHQNIKLAGGFYDDKGLKMSKWTELNKFYGQLNQLTHQGEYKNGKRVKQWSIIYRDETIGRGSYNENGIKTDLWIEPSKKYCFQNQIIYQGDYKNGQRIGQWSIKYRIQHIFFCFKYLENYPKTQPKYSRNYHEDSKDRDNQQKYYERKRMMPNIELDEGKYYYQAIHRGELRNNTPVGKWTIEYKNQIVGGGIYDEKGIKIGQWIELDVRYSRIALITYQGEYKNGLRSGEWKIICKNKTMGCVLYGAQGQIINKWNQLEKNFNIFYFYFDPKKIRQ